MCLCFCLWRACLACLPIMFVSRLAHENQGEPTFLSLDAVLKLLKPTFSRVLATVIQGLDDLSHLYAHFVTSKLMLAKEMPEFLDITKAWEYALHVKLFLRICLGDIPTGSRKIANIWEVILILEGAFRRHKHTLSESTSTFVHPIIVMMSHGCRRRGWVQTQQHVRHL